MVKQLAGLTAFILSLSSCYVLGQAGPFLKHRISAVPVEKLLADSDTAPELRRFLILAEDIRRFSREELGLSDTDNYRKLTSLARDYLALVIQAAEEFSVEPYTFSYPVLGELPYKGFFRKEAALKERRRLEARGLDVYLRPVDAFSSLGFFRDPLYSFMSGYTPDRLAELIIHEQTHATLFIKGESRFNERLATLVGREGARLFMERRYGTQSPEWREMELRRAAGRRFAVDMKELAAELEDFYRSTGDEEGRRKGKRRILADFLTDFRAAHPERYPSGYFALPPDFPLNNAFLSLYRLYQEPDGPLERLYGCYDDIPSFLGDLQAALAEDADPWKIVGELYKRKGEEPNEKK